jgi:P27 family predicted phage terminase small subunit
LQGTFRRNQEPEREPEYSKPRNETKPPVWLNKWAKEYWKEHIHELIIKGVMSNQDLPLYEILAQTYGEMREYHYLILHDASGKQRTKEEYVEERNYNMSRMPELVYYNKSQDDYAKLCAKFGISPSDRGKVDLGKKDTSDPLADMLAEVN